MKLHSLLEYIELYVVLSNLEYMPKIVNVRIIFNPSKLIKISDTSDFFNAVI